MGILQGCSDGYWKTHTDSWAATEFDTDDLFDNVFGRNAFPELTLLDVLNTGGGGLDALGRQTVGALLNSAHPSVNYPLTTAEVITLFQTAFDSGNYEAQKNAFEAFNKNLPCPLN